jgi:hypothetical protein
MKIPVRGASWALRARNKKHVAFQLAGRRATCSQIVGTLANDQADQRVRSNNAIQVRATCLRGSHRIPGACDRIPGRGQRYGLPPLS